MMGVEKAAAGDGARERREEAERREGKKKTRGKKGQQLPKYILENSCYSLSGVLEKQPEQSVLFCGPHESVFSSGL